MGDKPKDAIGNAIDTVEANAEEPKHLIGSFVFNDTGETMTLTVPTGFTADQFETAVNVLTQLRAMADQIRAAKASPIVKPERPQLRALDGRRLI